MFVLEDKGRKSIDDNIENDFNIAMHYVEKLKEELLLIKKEETLN